MTGQANCIRSSEKYWGLDPAELFLHVSLIPNDSMSLGGKLNAIFRVTLLLFALMLIFQYKYSVYFLVFATIINLVFYFIYKNDY